ncbi:MAG: glycine cleavage system protein GcvH [Myxococcota bacterium]
MSIPDDLKYTKEHEWARKEGDVVVVGVTHYAQDQLGDVVFIEFPETGTQVIQGEALGTLESVKAVSDLLAPLSGEVAEINDALADAPEAVNSDPYGDAWMVKIKPADAADYDTLMSPADYAKIVEAAG